MLLTREDLLRMDGKLDGVLSATRDHETRLREVEKSIAEYVTKDEIEETFHQRKSHNINWTLSLSGVVSALISGLAFIAQRH
jgi:hypothetical protein